MGLSYAVYAARASLRLSRHGQQRPPPPDLHATLAFTTNGAIRRELWSSDSEISSWYGRRQGREGVNVRLNQTKIGRRRRRAEGGSKVAERNPGPYPVKSWRIARGTLLCMTQARKLPSEGCNGSRAGATSRVSSLKEGLWSPLPFFFFFQVPLRKR